MSKANAPARKCPACGIGFADALLLCPQCGATMTIPHGRYLKTARAMMGITQQTLADRIGVTQSTVAGWENSANLTERTVRRHAAAMGYRVDLSLVRLGD